MSDILDILRDVFHYLSTNMYHLNKSIFTERMLKKTVIKGHQCISGSNFNLQHLSYFCMNYEQNENIFKNTFPKLHKNDCRLHYFDIFMKRQYYFSIIIHGKKAP